MFGIADAEDCGSSGDSADITGGIISDTPAVYQKRHLSPADGGIDAPSCAKQPRLFDTESHDNIFHRPDDKNVLRISSVSKRLRTRRRVITQQALEAFNGDSCLRRSVGTRDMGSDGRQSDYEESSSDDRSSVREDGLSLHTSELKEVRVLLHDFMHSKNKSAVDASDKQLPSTTSKQNNLWEVEKIIQKREQNGSSLYLIKWKNWDAQHNTWEPLCNLVNCNDLLCQFENEQRMLINQFKTKVNFYPNARDVEHFLAQMRCKNMTVDNIISAFAGDDVYNYIRRYFKYSSRRGKLGPKIKQHILCMQLIEMRRDQLDSLHDWENEMNNISQGKPKIQVENLVDLEGAPKDFFYIDSYLPGNSVIIPDDPPIGCECNVCESSDKSGCCFAQNGASSLPYTTAFRVRVPPGTPIYECNKRCACDVLTCRNRVVQRGTNAQLCIFRTDNGRGWGVRTLRAIKKGTFVTQYVGEVINSEEAEKRGKQYNVTGRTYLFDLDYNETDEQCPYTVDAAMYGNVSHFINHSCDPNLAVYAIWINCLDPNLPNLALFATKNIKQNEELTFDYTCQKMQQQLLDDEPNAENGVSANRIPCKCGAATCRRYLF
nr:PREDICTED: histone-lysine N-methyltransferase SUV39H2 [Linepithema humile]